MTAFGVCVLSFFLFAFTAPRAARNQFGVPHFDFLAPKFEAQTSQLKHLNWVAAPDSTKPIKERFGDFINNNNSNPYDLRDPKAVEQKVEYDPVTGLYIVTEKIGDDFFRAPTYMTFEEYTKWRDRKQQQEYFDRLQGVATPGKKSAGSVDPIAKFNIKNSLIERLFGGTTVDIRPQGNINLTFGYNYQKVENPILTLRQQRQGIFDFDMGINMSAQGKIGEKLNLNFNYNTQATFDLENQMKLNYDTKGFSEDEILQNIEAGNVSMPLRSNLIKGAQNLFGIKTELKFGHLRTTLLAAQQRSRQQQLTLQGGSAIQTFEKPIDEYDENRHFFISHWNRDQFEPALKCLPVPMSLFTITRMEVWITNDRQLPGGVQPNGGGGVRDIVALADLGEPERIVNTQFLDPSPPAKDIKGKGLPDNKNNGLYPRILNDLNGMTGDTQLRRSDRVVSLLKNNYGLKQIRDFEKQQARILSPSEYSFNDQLGFVSVNVNVQPDQVVGVAMEYTYNGLPYKIGEFSSEVASGDTLNQNVLFVKMLKSTTANVKLPIWDLMMKNVYSIGSVNVDPNEFRFDIFYEEPGKGQRRFLNEDLIRPNLKSKPLLQLFRLDTLNLQGDPGPDGIFDFVPGLTINLRSGRVMLPVLEPFGSYLWGRIQEGYPGGDVPDPDSIQYFNRYVYQQLYDSTLFRAREFQQLNRFTLKGSYKGSNNSEISLGTFNLPKGSVRVSAGGRQLIEGRDYTVDYNIGKVKILADDVLQSGQSVNVSFEDNTLFGFQNRSMVGVRLDYEINKNMAIGGTFMNLFERPLTQKVNYGDDPINNKMYGLDFNITKDAPWLTKLVDKIPLINTKEASQISSQIEVAALQPGHNRAINQGGEGGGTVYLDDFEGTTANQRIDFPANQWFIASTPQGDEKTKLFPEAESEIADDSLLGFLNGVNRARLSWYNGGEVFFRSGADASRPYTRTFNQTDLFPNRQIAPNEQPILRGLDVTMFPRERGPYNFELQDGSPVSAGLTQSGDLNDPRSRWAGFMKGLNNNDFEAANIEFIEFWMLNPYMNQGDNNPVSDGGDMYIDLGSISEDIMRDSRQFFENSLPTGSNSSKTVNTRWGRVPVLPPIVNAFDNDPAKRERQDIGLDGLDNDQEKNFYASWLSQLSPGARTRFQDDPSGDDFVYFGDARFDDNSSLFERYRFFNNSQGNSPVNNNTQSGPFSNPSATNLPDVEDLNRDNSLNEAEAYFRYKLPLKKGTIPDGSEAGLDLSDPTLSQIVTETQTFVRDGQTYVWYRFKLPLDVPSRTTVGGIQDFRSIRFLRMFWKGFTERVTFRFATIELGRNQWRRFTQNLADPTVPGCDVQYRPIAFDVNAVSIEENSARLPFNYTIPFGISREQSVGAFPSIQQNEQALAINVCDLVSCDARGIFKTLNMDLRQFDRLKMFAHLEGKGADRNMIDSSDLTIFVRLGSDFVRNYYEYEIPLYPSDENSTAILSGNPDSREYKQEVWRGENTFDFPLELLTKAKTERNATPNAQFDLPYIIADPANPRNKVKIVGNPNLGYVKGAMIGVRNVDPKNANHCFEVWVNEMRLNGFNEKGGYAGQARVDMKLADLGNISLAGNYTSIGWGSIEQKLVQRQREEVLQGDASINVELSKFFGEKSGIRLPFYAQYSNVTRNPEYDPYDLDIKLKDKIRAEADPAKRDSIRSVAQDVTVTRGYNFTNVRKERRGGPRKVPMPWNIENFSLTYAFNQTKRRTPFLINDQQNKYNGALDWQYATGLKPITPFKKLIKNDKYLKFITEFNFNPLPNTYGFNSTMERVSAVTTYRFAGEDPSLNTYHNRRFTWDRNYDLGWDITKTLRFNYDATARSLIDEPYQTKPDGVAYTRQERRDSILTNLRKLGRPKNYTHNASLNYTLPFKVIPMMDWITMRASYTAGYTWTAQSLKLANLDAGIYQDQENERDLGNVIQNNSVRQINGEFNFEGLYNKSKYLSRINKPAKPGGPGSKNKSNRNNEEAPGGGGLTPGGRDTGGGGDRGSGGDLTGGGRGRNKDKASGDNKNSNDRQKNDPTTPPDPTNPTAGNPSAPGAGGDGKAGAVPTPGPGGSVATTGGKDAKGKDGKDKKQGAKDKDDKGDKDKKKKDRQPSMAERIALRPLMLVRKARFTYSENYGSVIPGFTPEPKLLGQTEGFGAPGWGYIAGIQPDNRWLDEAAANGYITHRPELNQQVTRNYTQNLDAGVTIEPFQDFRVELTANKQYTRNNTELFKDQNFQLGPDSVRFEHRAQRDLGSYTVSYFALNTLFGTDLNQLFDRFATNRSVISKRLGVEVGNTNPHLNNGSEYAYGYGKTHQQVLIPAFISAYTDADPNTVGLNIFRTRPAVNWKLNYGGLSKIGKMKKIFSSIQIQHGYKSTLQVSSYNTDIFYQGTPQQTNYAVEELNADYIARFEIPQVVINEAFQPLLGIDVKLKNEMTFKVDFKKQRTLAMSFIDYQLAETQSESYTVGFGHRIKNVNIPFLTGKKSGAKGKTSSKKKKSSKKKAPTKPTTGPTPPPGSGSGQQANDLNIKFDFEIRDDITVNHRLDQADVAEPTRGQRTISINPSVEYALNKRLKLRLFTDYRKTVPKTSQSFPITTLNSGVTIQFSLN